MIVCSPQAQVCLASVYSQEPARDGSKSVQYLKMAAESDVSAILEASDVLSMVLSFRFHPPPPPSGVIHQSVWWSRESQPWGGFFCFCITTLLRSFNYCLISLQSYSLVQCLRALSYCVLIVTSSVLCPQHLPIIGSLCNIQHDDVMFFFVWSTFLGYCITKWHLFLFTCPGQHRLAVTRSVLWEWIWGAAESENCDSTVQTSCSGRKRAGYKLSNASQEG